METTKHTHLMNSSCVVGEHQARTLVLRTVHALLRMVWLQGAEIRTLGPVTSIRQKIKNSWCASKGCRVQKLGPYVWFCGGRATG